MKTEWRLRQFYELSLDELYDILALRQEVFVVEQDCAFLDADGWDQQSWHLMAYADKRLQAYSRILPRGVAYPDHASVGRIITAHHARSKGLGRELIKRSIGHLRELWGAVPVSISAQSYLRRLYESFGFRQVGEEYLEDGIPHIKMNLIH